MILGIDTSGGDCSVCVWDGQEIRAFLCETILQGHAAVLPLMVDQALKDANVTPSDLSTVLVTLGPGSFTGIRVGLAFAKGFTSPLSAKLYGLTSFEMVYGGIPSEEIRDILVALDTKRGDYYTQWIRGNTFEEPQILENDQVEDIVNEGQGLVVGDDPMLQNYTLKHKGADALIQAFQKGYHREPDPFYLRPPDVSL